MRNMCYMCLVANRRANVGGFVPINHSLDMRASNLYQQCVGIEDDIHIRRRMMIKK